MRHLGIGDILVIAFLTGLAWIVLLSGHGFNVKPQVEMAGYIDLSARYLPYYALRSLTRMFAGFILSTLFTMIYGYIAAHNHLARMVLIPLLDVLQSVPVLGFLSITVASFSTLFPGSNIGFELASIFAIFTSQAWNMTFSFYESLSTLPEDLREAASVFGLTKWQVFWRLELPYSMISLVWNGMMSFGGGWFFLAASEAITVLGRNVRLPGIGSYMATAIEKSNLSALLASLASMILIIVITDQVIWRPMVAWSMRFKMELTPTDDEVRSALLDVFGRSLILNCLMRHFLGPLGNRIARIARFTMVAVRLSVSRWETVFALLNKIIFLATRVLAVVLTGLGFVFVVKGIYALSGSVDLGLISKVFYRGFLTLLRVMGSVMLGMLWTVPVGVKLGSDPAIRRIAQPLVQIAASFPANMLFPFVIVLYMQFHVNFELGSILLMMLGTQWYLLFNVIAGAMAIPRDLYEAADIYRLKGFSRWRYFILPAIFPSIVTGVSNGDKIPENSG